MKVGTELVLSVCCSTIERHEVLCCWEMLQGAEKLKPWLCSLCWGIAGAGSAGCSALFSFPPLLLFESLLMLFIERGLSSVAKYSLKVIAKQTGLSVVVDAGGDAALPAQPY